jgi:hypothetical protein
MNLYGEYADNDASGMGATSGRFDKAEVDALLKAMAANDVTGTQTWDRTDLSAAPLKVESLEATMKILTAQPQHYPLFAKVAKKPVANNVAEYLQLLSYGNFDGGFLNEGELPEVSDSVYRRKAQFVKYMGIVGGVTLQAQLVSLGGGIQNMLATEVANKSKALAQMIEYHFPFADSRIVPTNFNGIFSQHEIESEYPSYNAYMSGENVIDCRGSILTDEVVERATLTTVEKYGLSDTIISHPAVFSNYNKRYYDNRRMFPTPQHIANQATGGRITEIFTQNGKNGGIKMLQSNFFRFGNVKSSLSAATNTKAPAAPSTVLANSTSSTFSKFYASDDTAGDYIYAVAAKNQYGESALTFAAGGAAVATTDGVGIQLSITPGVTSQYPQTGWSVYRSKVDPSATSLHDVKMYKIFEVGMEAWEKGYDMEGTTVTATRKIMDNNRFMAGTDQAFVVEWDSDQIFAWLQLAPMMKMNLAITAPINRFMILLFGTPVLYQPLKTIRIINIGDKFEK